MTNLHTSLEDYLSNLRLLEIEVICLRKQNPEEDLPYGWETDLQTLEGQLRHMKQQRYRFERFGQ